MHRAEQRVALVPGAAFKDYFTGNVDEDTAKANFQTAIQEKYPELTDVVWPA